MHAVSDDELRAVQDRKRAELGILPEPPIPEPAELACRACGKAIHYPGPLNRRIIGEWNQMATAPPRLTCGVCKAEAEQGRWRAAREADEQAHAARLEATRADLPGALAACGVPKHWLAASFDLCPDLPPELVATARHWAADPDGMIYLHGPPGAGKTWLAVSMMRAVLESGRFDRDACRYVGERDFLDELKAAFDPEAPPVPSRLLPPAHPRRVPLLLYDDLAAARQTDWTRGEIATLLETRHAQGLSTIITGNVKPDGLAGAVDGRVVSRIAESRMMWGFPGRDLRIKGTVGVPAEKLRNTGPDT